ncbi:hypothetical protein Taro_012839 [Colocasia esculenta]|uniref:Uncharacterized protein n=1 Tax=Colocasia esculenta TaxID=4460 RepID=A0A843UKD5_COLES|nr:hypothetical protein [Colocasia esculenta]
MALSAGSTWAPVSPSPSLQKRRETKVWRFIEGSEYRWLNTARGTPRQLTYAFVNESKRILKRKLIAHSSSASQSSSAELSTDDLNDIAGDGSLKTNSCSNLARNDGKPGFISFYGLSYQIKEEIQVPVPRNEPSNVFWFVGPTVLVFSLVFPSFYLRRVLLTIFEDSLFTVSCLYKKIVSVATLNHVLLCPDFLILFVTEALFYAGVAIYVFVIDHVCGNRDRVTHNIYGQMKTNFGLRVFSVAMLVLSLIIPLVTMGMVWPWTGPAASATLAPYLVGLVVQFAFEQYARYRKSTAWAIIPIVFQVYRLHQLNRAAQLVTALSFSVRGIESTAQTVAINNSLGTLLNVLQVLGVICIWSLSSFLMRFLPSSPTVVEP